MTALVAAKVDGEELWQDLERLRRLGARQDGGVARLALSDSDVDARLWLASAGHALDCKVSMDDVGNLFLRYEGTNPEAKPVVLGSHMDSQPTGGAYDGTYGVLASLQALRAIKRSKITLRRPIEVVSWTNEEGVRYKPGCTGAACFTGSLALETAYAKLDDEGVSFGEAMKRCRSMVSAAGVNWSPLRRNFHAFLEPHIEQGPVLEANGASVGVVTGIQGVSWFDVEITGRAAHAGTTPRSRRYDALEGAMALANEMRDLCRDKGDMLRFTIGRFVVAPGAVNTVPESVHFSVDLRHPDAEELTRLRNRFANLAKETWSGCDAKLRTISELAPVLFPHWVINTVAEAAEKNKARSIRMPSGAFHDALHLASHCATGMIFIPCRDGISHHPDEEILPEHAETGARVLAKAAVELAR